MGRAMQQKISDPARAVVFRQPRTLSVEELALAAPGPEDAVVDVAHSGVSTGTERLLWTGRMPHFPGMGYPLVPGYEAVGEVVEAGPESGLSVGQTVFAPGGQCYGAVRGLFGGASSRIVSPGGRLARIDPAYGAEGVLLALAATAYHAMAGSISAQPDLIVGHGVLGRLLARLSSLVGGAPATVWETDPARRGDGEGYRVIDPADDDRRDYRVVYDVSGDVAILDQVIGRLAKGGEVVLAGFYSQPLSFAFPPAFMREARIRVAAEWTQSDLRAVTELVDAGKLSLGGLITHHRAAADAEDAYQTAFEDARCLKMILDWSPTA